MVGERPVIVGGEGEDVARSSRPSCQDAPDDLAVDVGQPEVAAGVAIGQPGVIEAQQVEDRGVEVVDVDLVVDGVVAVIVGGAVDDARA